MRKRTITDKEYFKNLKQFLCDRGDDFVSQRSGSMEKIIHKDTTYTYVNLKLSSGKGHHLSKTFRSDIDIWLQDESNKKSLKQWTNSYPEQMFNLTAIEKVVGKASIALDINDCYWDTARKLGYITEKTYIIGKRKKEWKTGRNACVGSLAKLETILPYVNGKPERKLKSSIRPDKNHVYIRNHIIGHVHGLFYRLYQELGDKFYMFLTDCVFTSHDKRRYIESYFENYGYKLKTKPIDFLAVDKKEKIIWWHDFLAEKKDEDGKIIKKGYNKYYIYAPYQLLHEMPKESAAIRQPYDKNNTSAIK